MTSITDINNEDSDEEYEKICEMFPDANFVVAIGLNELEYIVTDKKHICIKHVYNCICYKKTNIKTRFFFIEGEKLTNKFIIDELIKQGLTLDCNHSFLEGFYKNLEHIIYIIYNRQLKK